MHLYNIIFIHHKFFLYMSNEECFTIISGVFLLSPSTVWERQLRQMPEQDSYQTEMTTNKIYVV